MCVQLVYNYTPFLFTGIKKDTREKGVTTSCITTPPLCSWVLKKTPKNKKITQRMVVGIKKDTYLCVKDINIII